MAVPLARGTIVYLSTVNVGALSLFAYDKAQASRGGQRVSERHLCQTALFGGWLGGLLAMQVFRHKTRKTSFQRKYASALATNAVVMLPVLAFMGGNTSYRTQFGRALRGIGTFGSGQGKGGGRKPPRYRR